MDEDVLSSREIEPEVRFRRVQAGTVDTVRKNSELLQVPRLLTFLWQSFPFMVCVMFLWVEVEVVEMEMEMEMFIC